MRVYNMENSSGNKVVNQFEIIDDNGARYFQSYQTVIAKFKGGKVYLDKGKWNYSTTTSTYRNIFLNETSRETAKKVKSGEYKLVNLNK